jgi:hypothetical protein
VAGAIDAKNSVHAMYQSVMEQLGHAGSARSVQYAASTGTSVALDAFVVGSATIQDSSTRVTYDTWRGARSALASGGTYRLSPKAGATSSLSFNGAGVDWVTATGPSYGEATVTIDGISQGTVDLYAASARWKVAESYGGFASGSHTIVVTVLGTKYASSTGTRVVVDAFAVHS